MEDKVEDNTNYSGLEEQIKERLSQNDKNRFVPIEERQDTSVLSVDVLRNLCQGKTCELIANCTRVRKLDPGQK